MSEVKEMLDRIIEDGVITREEHDAFMDLINADGEIDEQESEQISRMFALLSAGQVQVVDEERQEAEAKRREDVKKALGL